MPVFLSFEVILAPRQSSNSLTMNILLLFIGTTLIIYEKYENVVLKIFDTRVLNTSTIFGKFTSDRTL